MANIESETARCRDQGPEGRDSGGRHSGVPPRRGARQGVVGDEGGPEVTIGGPLAFSGTLWGNCHCVPVIVLVRGCNAWDDSAELKTEMDQVAEAAAGEIDATG